MGDFGCAGSFSSSKKSQKMTGQPQADDRRDVLAYK
jgi:hypothetical protein